MVEGREAADWADLGKCRGVRWDALRGGDKALRTLLGGVGAEELLEGVAGSEG